MSSSASQGLFFSVQEKESNIQGLAIEKEKDYILTVPYLGPVIGHTTTTSTSVWLMAHHSKRDHRDRYIYMGLAYALSVQSKEITAKNVVMLQRETNYTGVVELEGLTPETKYTIYTSICRVNKNSVPPAISDFDLDSALTLTSTSKHPWKSGSVWTFPVASEPSEKGKPSNEFVFYLGSCHFYLGDNSIFNKIATCIQKDDVPTLMLHIGDQVYADHARTLDEFNQKYVDKYSLPSVRNLLAHVPNYMILDDHEIRNNWTLDMSMNPDIVRHAFKSYHNYQWVLSPQMSHAKGYDYNFTVGNYPFYVMDVRSQKRATSLMCDEQYTRLDAFLNSIQTLPSSTPKFLISSTSFLPPCGVDYDQWGIADIDKITVLLLKYNINNVTVLCGDVHCALSASATFGPPERQLKIHSITSSPLCMPYVLGIGRGFRKDFRKNGVMPLSSGNLNYAINKDISGQMSGTDDNNFARISIQKNVIRVEWHGTSCILSTMEIAL